MNAQFSTGLDNLHIPYASRVMNTRILHTRSYKEFLTQTVSLIYHNIWFMPNFSFSLEFSFSLVLEYRIVYILENRPKGLYRNHRLITEILQ